MSRSELSPEASALLFLGGGLAVVVSLFLVATRLPTIFGPTFALVCGAGMFTVVRHVRRELREYKESERWRAGLPPPVLPLPPPPEPSPPQPLMPSPPTGVGLCPFDGQRLTGVSPTGEVVVDDGSPTDLVPCACRAEVLTPDLFAATLERYGLDPEVVRGVAELHPSSRACPLCGRRLTAPPLRDARPLVCVGCGAAAFRDGDLAVFRGEALPTPRARPKPVDDRWSDLIPSRAGTFGFPGDDGDGGDSDSGDGGDGGDGGGGD